LDLWLLQRRLDWRIELRRRVLAVKLNFWKLRLQNLWLWCRWCTRYLIWSANIGCWWWGPGASPSWLYFLSFWSCGRLVLICYLLRLRWCTTIFLEQLLCRIVFCGRFELCNCCCAKSLLRLETCCCVVDTIIIVGSDCRPDQVDTTKLSVLLQ